MYDMCLGLKPECNVHLLVTSVIVISKLERFSSIAGFEKN